MGKLDGKIAVVTGASRGIGQEIATLFAAEGARVACLARTVDEGDHKLFEGSVNRTVEQIRTAGGEAFPVACDVSTYENCEAAIRDVRQALGPIDVLVNNAALTYFLPIAQFSISKWQRSLAVNFNGPFYLSQLVLEDMIPRKTGAIVNISSGAAIGPGRAPYDEKTRAIRGGTLYGAEKAALERFTQGLAAEVYDDGISVTCVSPSMIVATPGVEHHQLLRGRENMAEPSEFMARSALLLATEPLSKVSGRVTYSQEILLEFGWIEAGHGIGIEGKGSGFSEI
ncbi:MAG: SDR family NAD(P)-dependent oxidoreductase [bacterium]|nr:SDR family NAD(P)-dependent oxidoreductase [bacterium]